MRMGAFDDELTALPGYAFIEVEQAEAAGLAWRAGVETDAVIDDAHRQRAVGLLQAHVDPACQRMAEDVVQAFLQHPVQRQQGFFVQDQLVDTGASDELAGDAARARELAQLHVDDGAQPEFQAGGPQLAQQLLHRAQRQVDIVERGADAVAQAVMALGGVLMQHHDVDTQGQQVLAQGIVQLARNAFAFVLAGGELVCKQFVQLLFGSAQGPFGPFAGKDLFDQRLVDQHLVLRETQHGGQVLGVAIGELVSRGRPEIAVRWVLVRLALALRLAVAAGCLCTHF